MVLLARSLFCRYTSPNSYVLESVYLDGRQNAATLEVSRPTGAISVNGIDFRIFTFHLSISGTQGLFSGLSKDIRSDGDDSVVFGTISAGDH